MLALLASLALAPQAARAQDAFEAERALRARALAPLRHEAELAADLASAAWSARVRALDALERSLAAGGVAALAPVRGALRAGLEHAHPSVRAAALRVGARADSANDAEGAPPGPELAHDTRLARAEYLRGGDVADPPWLDPDPHVGRAGLVGLCLRRDPSAEPWLEALRARLVPGFDGRGVLERVDELVELGVRARFDDALWQHIEDAVRAGAPDAAVLVALGRARVHPPADPVALVALWPAEDAWRLVANRARVAARGLGEVAARAFLERDPPRFEAFAHSVPPQVAAGIALAHPAFDADASAALWSALRGRPARWEFEAASAWLAPDRSPEERAEALTTFAASFSVEEGGEVGRLLALALDDPEPAIAAEAFVTLCNADDPGPWLEALAAAWRALPAAERVENLRRLPRGVALTPLRRDLLDLGQLQPELRGAVAELLARFDGDAGVAAALTEWLTEACDRLALDPSVERRAQAEIAGQACASALFAVAGDEAAQPLAAALEVVAQHSNAVGKVLIALLARIPGRDVRRWTREGVPSRLRAESALQTADRGGFAAYSSILLMELYDGLDEVLRGRALRVIGYERSLTGAFFVYERALAEDALPSEPGAAVEALGPAWADDSVECDLLLQLARDARSGEVRLAALVQIGEYARKGQGGTGAFLRARFDEVEGALLGADGAGLARDEFEFEREALLRALARAEPGRVEVPRVETWEALAPPTWLRRPLDAARGDFDARVRGRSRATPEFRFGGELAFGRMLAERGALARALAEAGPWWGCDARFLLALAGEAEAGGADADTIDALLGAGLIGLFGEAPALDRPQAEFRALRARFALAEARADWRACEQIARLLLERRLRNDADARLFERAFGDYDPVAGEDGDARLVSALLQARSRRHLAEGRPDRARGAAARARAAVGHSRDALAAQRMLERALEAAGQ